MPDPDMTPKQKAAYARAEMRIEDCRRSEAWNIDLGNLGLSDLPPEIGLLRWLVTLDVSHNQLTTLPPEIGQLTCLSQIDLYGNHIVTLPSEIGHLTALKRLRMGNNYLSELPPWIGQLSKLDYLDLSNNRLWTLPPEIGQLIALVGLDLRANLLTALPPKIGQLKALTQLDLTSNQLSTLPQEIANIPRLTQLFLHGNSGLGLPPEVLGPTWQEISHNTQAASPRTILAHYLARKSQGERSLNEVRLVLVGRGAAGKTSVVERLVKNTFRPGQEETPGIALSDWLIEQCPGGPVTAHVWDFAGQVITHSMHRYFLSHRTVYLLVLTQREDSAEEDADYWLKLIQGYGVDRTSGATGAEGPPVLVALNKSDTAWVRVDRGALREKYPFIVGFVETDCQTGRGIAELRKSLCDLLDRPDVRAWVRHPYAARWWEVKEEIRRVQQERPHISWEEWKEICARCGVNDDEGQHAASRDLHTLGIALNYGEDERLRDNTVLRPSWVTYHCYNLIRHAANHAGELHRGELEPVLSAQRGETPGEPDPRLHLYLMRLMERFEAAYPLGEEWPPEKWLVPLALPDSQPAGVEEFGKLPTAEAARLRYTYPSVPPGLVAQFIVRTHPLIEPGMVWARGAVLSLNGARALVRAVSKTEVEITARGQNREARRDLAGLCREELGALNRQLSGQVVTETTEVEAGGEVVWLSVRTLEKDEQKGKAETAVATEEGSLFIPTRQELDEFGTLEGRWPDRHEFRMWIERDMAEGKSTRGNQAVSLSRPKPHIFISYSHMDERFRRTLELHLEVLKIQGLVHWVWHDRRIQPGMDWDREIQQQLAEADVVLLLTSTAALASDYINQEELRPALERHAKGEAHVVPIILERCDWVATFAASPALSTQKDPKRRVPQALPRDGKPIRAFTPQSEGWAQVAKGLKELLTEVKAKLR